MLSKKEKGQKIMKIQGNKRRLGFEKDSMDNDENWKSSDTPTNPASLNANDALAASKQQGKLVLASKKLKQNLIYLHGMPE